MKAKVWVKSSPGHSIGKVHNKYSDAEVTKLSGGLYDLMVNVDVPVEMENIAASDLKSFVVADYWTKDGEADVTMDPGDDTWVLVPEHYELEEKVEADYPKEFRILKEFIKLEKSLKNSKAKFKGKETPELYMMAVLMGLDPGFFASPLLEVEVKTPSFNVGVALDDEAKVTSFSGELLEVIKQHVLDNMLDHKNFRKKEAVITAE